MGDEGDVVRAATVLSRTGPISPGEVVLAAGRVIDVRPATGPAPDIVLAPGFVDLEVCSIEGVDVGGSVTSDEWAHFDEVLMTHGVTTWCPAIASRAKDETDVAVANVLQAASRPSSRRPAIAGAHLLHPFGRAGHQDGHAHAADVQWLNDLPTIVRLATIDPTLPNAMEAIDRMSAHGMLVVVSSECDAATLDQAVDMGAQLTDSSFISEVAADRRSSGGRSQTADLFTEDALALIADDRLSIALDSADSAVDDRVLGHLFDAKGADSLALVTSKVPGPSISQPRRQRTTIGNTSKQGSSVADVLRLAVKGGASLHDAVTAASTTPARLIGLHDRGSIAAGMRADLVALDADLQVSAVWLGGPLVWPIQ